MVVLGQFSAHFCILYRFRTDLGDADVRRMQDLGAGIVCFIVVWEQFGVSRRTA